MTNEGNKKIIVTGGTGLLGSHLLVHLVQENTEITALKRPQSDLSMVKKIFQWYFKDPGVFKKINWVSGDVTDYDTLKAIFSKDSQVYHTAGKVSFDKKDRQQLFEVNVKGTENVVNAGIEKKIAKLCHVSSIAAIGRASESALTHEEIVLENLSKISAYGISKYEGEREVWRGIAEGLHAVIVNPTIILGPGNWNQSSARLFKQVYKGLKFYTSGTNGYVDVNDLASIMIGLMKSKTEAQRFIVTAENIAYKQLFDWMAEELKVTPPKHRAGPTLSAIAWRSLKALSLFTGKPPLITRETAQTANSLYHYSNEKILTETGFRFKPVKETIKETARYFLTDPQGGI